MNWQDELAAELAEIQRQNELLRFVVTRGRRPYDDVELAAFLRDLTAEEKGRRAAARATAEDYHSWLSETCSRLAAELARRQPDYGTALRKLLSAYPCVKAVVQAGGLNLGLPVGEHDLTLQAEAAFRSCLQRVVPDNPHELEDALAWSARWWLFPIPQAHFLDEGVPCLALSNRLYSTLAIEVRRASFTRHFSGYPFRFEYPDDVLGYLWHVLPVGVVDGPRLPLALLDTLAQGQVEAPGVKVVARRPPLTTYYIEGFQVVVHDNLASFLKRLPQPWPQALAHLGIVDSTTAAIIAHKLAHPPVPPPAPAFSNQDFIDSLTALGFSRAEAEKLLEGLPVGLSLQEAIETALKAYGRR